jgi:hypothetical protein
VAAAARAQAEREAREAATRRLAAARSSALDGLQSRLESVAGEVEARAVARAALAAEQARAAVQVGCS